MKLHHFTCAVHYQSIIASGRIDVTESNIGSGRPDWEPYGEHVGPDVVWLTSNEDPDRHGLDDPDLESISAKLGIPAVALDKHLVRLTVDLPDDDVHAWFPWSRKQRMNPKWRRRIEDGMRARSWYVIERPVQTTEVVEVAFASELAEFLVAP